jgi:hypothetical protein
MFLCVAHNINFENTLKIFFQVDYFQPYALWVQLDGVGRK